MNPCMAYASVGFIPLWHRKRQAASKKHRSESMDAVDQSIVKRPTTLVIDQAQPPCEKYLISPRKFPETPDSRKFAPSPFPEISAMQIAASHTNELATMPPMSVIVQK